MEQESTYTAFVGTRRVAAGRKPELLAALKRRFDDDPDEMLLVFEDETGHQIELDLRGTLHEVLARAVGESARGPGRPKLGVVSREVTLLPRHWQWLEQQPNGISAALRRLVEEARKAQPGKQHARRLRAALSRFMTAMAGDRPNYEEASRALFAGDQPRLEALVRAWPKDVREYVVRLSREAEHAERGDVRRE